MSQASIPTVEFHNGKDSAQLMMEKGATAATNGAARSAGWVAVQSGGVFLSQKLGIILAVAVAASLVVVGVTVHFAAAPECDTLTQAEQWEVCKDIAAEMGECLCFTTPAPTTQKPTTTVTAAPTQPPLPTGLRLPKTFKPSHYNVELQPRIYPGDDFGFSGEVEIWVTCEESTNEIILHIDQLTIWDDAQSKPEVRANGPQGALQTLDRWEEDKDRHFLKLYLTNDLTVGNTYYIHMEFNGTHIHPDWKGFYRSSYVEYGKTEWLVATQFQRTQARRAFPCFDEPSFKATFNITLVRKSTHSSICNMPRIGVENREDDWVADIYDQTVVMPSYLLAFVVSKFEYTETTTAKGNVFRIWSRPSFINQTHYALEVSGPILEGFEDWTGIDFVLPKTDQIAIPDFAAGAMENWGLITYRERALLINPDYSDAGDYEYVAGIISHELAHMWWGNLVTCDWWDDTWLNEGFATYFADFGVEFAQPTWRMEEFFVKTVQFIMEYDGYGTSQPIFLEGIEHHDELFKAFNTITYRKGGSVIRMMKYFLTEPTFRQGLSNYLNEHKYSTSKHEDLYRALQQQAEKDGTASWNPSVTNLSKIMDTWIEQMNHPLVKVTTLGGGQVKVEQNVFRYDPEVPPNYESPFGDFIWDIPLTHVADTEIIDIETNQTSINYHWINRDQEVTISGLVGNWQLVNIFQQGFFRVQYDSQTWQDILTQLKADHTVFPIINRGQLIDDAFQIARTGAISELNALQSTEYLSLETEYLPIYAGLSTRILYMDKMFYGTPHYDHLNTYITNLVTPEMYNHVGWDNSNPDEHIEKYARAIVLSEACRRRYSDCIVNAINLYEQFMDDPSTNPIGADLRSFVYCNGIRNGGIEEWEFALDMYNKDYGVWVSLEKNKLLEGLSCATQPWIQRRYLSQAVAWESTTAINLMANQPEAQAQVWEFLDSSWDTLPTSINKYTILNTLTDWMSSSYDLLKLQRFIDRHQDSQMTSSYTSLLDKVNSNIVWMSTNQEPISQWLQTVNG